VTRVRDIGEPSPCHDLVRQITFSEHGGAVDSVMIGGRLVLDHGRLTTIDETALRRDARAAAERLGVMNEPMRQFSRKFQDIVGTFCRALSCEPFPIHRQAWDDASPTERPIRAPD
jgi:5-methylthioadenosine/S-adenosylhomocysteine deaminase